MPYRRYPPKEAREHFDEFLRTVPVRIDALAQAIAANGGRCNLDLSFDSCDRLCEWMASVLTQVYLSSDETRVIEARMPALLHGFTPGWDFSAESFSLCFDCGVYSSEALRARWSSLSWDTITRPPSSADYLFPVLLGFSHGLAFNGFAVALTIASSVFAAVPRSGRVSDALLYWGQYVPGEKV